MSVEEQRKSMEELANYIKGGYYKEFCKAQKALFDEYIRMGFTREESLQLIMNTHKT